MKKRIFALVLAAMMAMSMVACGGASNPGDAAVEYVEAAAKGEFSDAMSYAIIDVEKLMDDLIEEVADQQDMSKSDAYEMMEEQFDGEYKIKNAGDYIDAVGKEMKEEMEDTKIKVKLDGEPEELDEDELEEAVSEFEASFEYIAEMGIDPDDYFDADKVKEGYTVTVVMTDDDGEENDDELTVVKYDGSWKILDMDMLGDVLFS